MFIVAKTVLKPKVKTQIYVLLKKIYGIGLYRSQSIIFRLTGRIDNSNITNFFKFQHYRWLNFQYSIKKFILNEKLRRIQQININALEKLGCFKGKRHKIFLPANGQRTRSNAITARYLGSGCFDYIPRRPTTYLKKIGSYVRRGILLKKNSDIIYNKLLHRNYLLYRSNKPWLFRNLVRKNKLGVYSRFVKIKKSNKVRKKIQKKVVKIKKK